MKENLRKKYTMEVEILVPCEKKIIKTITIPAKNEEEAKNECQKREFKEENQVQTVTRHVTAWP